MMYMTFTSEWDGLEEKYYLHILAYEDGSLHEIAAPLAMERDTGGSESTYFLKKKGEKALYAINSHFGDSGGLYTGYLYCFKEDLNRKTLTQEEILYCRAEYDHSGKTNGYLCECRQGGNTCSLDDYNRFKEDFLNSLSDIVFIDSLERVGIIGNPEGNPEGDPIGWYNFNDFSINNLQMSVDDALVYLQTQ